MVIQTPAGGGFGCAADVGWGWTLQVDSDLAARPESPQTHSGAPTKEPEARGLSSLR